MKRLLIVLGVFLSGVVFCTAPGYAACTLEPLWSPFMTVIKYQTGKAKILEMWECAKITDPPQGNGVCFYNYLDNNGHYQYMCISGEFKVLYPINFRPDGYL